MKSTHSGHCQACGSLQKLPNGKLSKHGYTVTHGFFSGVCAGAHALPFEQSCELVKDFIANAQQHLDRVTAFQAKLRTAADDNKGWARVSYKDPRGYGYSDKRVWEVVTFNADVITSNDGTFKYMRYSYTDSRGNDYGKNISRGEVYGPKLYDAQITDASVDAALLELTTQHNRTYADWFEHEADSLRRYITWQTERVANWKSAPLLAHNAKDKEGFKPTEARY